MRMLLAATAVTAAVAALAPAASAQPVRVAHAGSAADGATATCTLTRTDGADGATYTWNAAVVTTHTPTVFRCWVVDTVTGDTRGPKPSRTLDPVATASGTMTADAASDYAVCVEVRWDGGSASGCDGA